MHRAQIFEKNRFRGFEVTCWAHAKWKMQQRRAVDVGEETSGLEFLRCENVLRPQKRSQETTKERRSFIWQEGR